MFRQSNSKNSQLGLKHPSVSNSTNIKVAIASKCATIGLGLQIKWSIAWISVFMVTTFTMKYGLAPAITEEGSTLAKGPVGSENVLFA